MKQQYFGWASVSLLCILLLGCSSRPSASQGAAGVGENAPPTSAPASSKSTVLNQAQALPISAQVDIGGKTIQLEVARTPKQQAIGLMHRSELADDRGMLFSFAQPRSIKFWMKNVRINLDMIFLLEGEVKLIAADVPPCTADPCPVYGPAELVDKVIELRGGRAAELGLKVGDAVTIQYDSPL